LARLSTGSRTVKPRGFAAIRLLTSATFAERKLF
jgi:hypothetical protein